MKLAILALFTTVANCLFIRHSSRSTESAAELATNRVDRRADSPVSDDVWRRAQCKGEQFVNAFPMSDADAGQQYTPPRSSAQSRWTGDLKSELATWGWTEDKQVKAVCQLDELALGKGWVEAAKQLGIGTEGWKDIWCYRFSHGSTWNVMARKTYKVDAKEYPVRILRKTCG